MDEEIIIDAQPLPQSEAPQPIEAAPAAQSAPASGQEATPAAELSPALEVAEPVPAPSHTAAPQQSVQVSQPTSHPQPAVAVAPQPVSQPAPSHTAAPQQSVQVSQPTTHPQPAVAVAPQPVPEPAAEVAASQPQANADTTISQTENPWLGDIATMMGSDKYLSIKSATESDRHQLVSLQGVPRCKQVPQHVWFTPFLLLITLGFAYILSIRWKAIRTELHTFFNPNVGSSIFGAQWLHNSQYKLGLSILSTAVIGTSLFFCFGGRDSVSGSGLQYIAFLVATAIYMLVRHGVTDFVQYTFCVSDTPSYSLSNAYLSLIRFAGIMLFPSALALSYGSSGVCAVAEVYTWLVLSLLTLAFIGKIIVIFFDGLTSCFYLILYLCTLEVLPLAALGASFAAIRSLIGQ